MYAVFFSPMFNVNASFYVEENITMEKNHTQHDNLVHGMTENVAPHYGGDHVFLSGIGLSKK